MRPPAAGGGVGRSGRGALAVAVAAGLVVGLAVHLVTAGDGTVLTAPDDGLGGGAVPAERPVEGVADPTTPGPPTDRPAAGVQPGGGGPVTTAPPRASRPTPPDLAAPDPSVVDARAARPGGDPDPADPGAVARAYVEVAETARADEAGTRRLLPYVAPENPEARVGVLVTDPPPEGRTRTAEVVGVELAARDGDRMSWEVTYRRHLVGEVPRPTDPVASTVVVLARQPDGGWLVAAHLAEAEPTG